MIIIHNFVLLCEHLINNAVGFTSNVSFLNDDDDDDVEEQCYCNVCYTLGNIILFATKRLEYKNV